MVIMISQGGDGAWGRGSAASIAQVSYTLFAVAILFPRSPLVARRLSINFARNFEERVSAVSSICYLQPVEKHGFGQPEMEYKSNAYILVSVADQ
jgi:hypothetical protein